MTGLLERLKAGKKNVRAVKFPGTDEQIGITVLTEAEVQASVFAAEKVFKDNGIEVTATTLGTYNAEVNTQLLYRALVNPVNLKADGTHERCFKSADELRRALGRAAKDALVEEYNALEDEANLSLHRMSDEEFENIFASLKKTPEAGNNLSLGTLRGLIIFLANRDANSQKGNGSMS